MSKALYAFDLNNYCSDVLVRHIKNHHRPTAGSGQSQLRDTPVAPYAQRNDGDADAVTVTAVPLLSHTNSEIVEPGESPEAVLDGMPQVIESFTSNMNQNHRHSSSALGLVANMKEAEDRVCTLNSSHADIAGTLRTLFADNQFHRFRMTTQLPCPP